MLSEKDKNNMHNLYMALLSLKTEEEVAAFLDDACTIKEIIDISTRLEVARMLDEGKVFSHISEETGCSSATISRVNKCLQFGPGGYRTVLDRINEK